MHYSDLTPTTDPKVLKTLEQWFAFRPEILVRSRLPRSGTEEFEFETSIECLTKKMYESPPFTWFTVWEHPQLPFRGIVDDAFIDECMIHFTEESEYLVVEVKPRSAGKQTWFHNASTNSLAILREELGECLGSPVAVGLHPSCIEERSDVIHVFTPNENGRVLLQSY